MFKTLKNAWNIPDLRRKLIYTLIIIIIYRFGAIIPVPYVDSTALNAYIQSASGSILQYLNILSGDAFSKATLFALSITPYITASIVMQLLAVAIPALERMSKDEEGKKKINNITRYVTVGLGLLTSFGYYMVMKNSYNVVTAEGKTFFGACVIIACYCAGASIIMWLGEKINENGIGNGISIILFANIVARGPSLVMGIIGAFGSNITRIKNGQTLAGIGWMALILIGIAFAIAVIGFVVFITNSERRVPVQYAKRVVGRKMYGGQSTNLPIKLNMSGVMPIIFASSITSLPVTIMQFTGVDGTGKSFWDGVYKLFSTQSLLYAGVFLLLIIAFSYFYIAISFNPVEVAGNLKKQGGFIPGIRPGRPTSDYIKKVLDKITLIGALFLSFIAVFPLILNIVTGGELSAIAFGGSSLLIVVGVALETVREIEAQMTLRNYKGFLE